MAEGRRRWLGGFVTGIVVSVLGTILAQMITGDEHSVPRPVADQFFHQYWKDRFEDKPEAWRHLSDEYRAKYNLTFENFGDDFAAYKAVDVKSVHVTEHRNTFEVTIAFVKKSGGRLAPETVNYHVHCGWWKSRAPLTSCTADELIIDDGDRPVNH